MRTRAPRLKVRCLECATTWHTSNPGPACPRCGGTDVDLAEPYDPGDEAYERAAEHARNNDVAATGGRDGTSR